MIGLRICLVTMMLTALYLFISVEISCLTFNSKANGSLIKTKNKVVGSKLIGQTFTSPNHFHGRPSSVHYRNDASGNSNFPYYSKELKDFISIESNNYLKTNEKQAPDLNSISESASGLDPHITKKNALSQISRISKNTKIDEKELHDLVNKKLQINGLSREEIVNTLELNIELEKLNAKKIRT